MCSSSEYIYTVDVYVGKSKDTRSYLGMGGDVVMKLLKKAKVPSHTGLKVYFNNYFTSLNLLGKLSSLGICASGTIRDNRLTNCLLPKKGTFRKKKRACDFATTSKLLVIKYKDNNVVTIASNFDSTRIGTT